jgi:hypothetical protein
MVTAREYNAMIDRCNRLARTTNPEWNARWLKVAAYLRLRMVWANYGE